MPTDTLRAEVADRILAHFDHVIHELEDLRQQESNVPRPREG
jgi:hypothetical protein